MSGATSAGADVGRAGTLGALLDIELDSLAALQPIEIEGCVETAAMEEVFLLILGDDEAEAAIGDDLLDGTGGHVDLHISPNGGSQIARSVREGVTTRSIVIRHGDGAS